eukprot:4500959-Pyramimonas_sp.AAC.1
MTDQSDAGHAGIQIHKAAIRGQPVGLVASHRRIEREDLIKPPYHSRFQLPSIIYGRRMSVWSPIRRAQANQRLAPRWLLGGS